MPGCLAAWKALRSALGYVEGDAQDLCSKVFNRNVIHVAKHYDASVSLRNDCKSRASSLLAACMLQNEQANLFMISQPRP